MEEYMLVVSAKSVQTDDKVNVLGSEYRVVAINYDIDYDRVDLMLFPSHVNAQESLINNFSSPLHIKIRVYSRTEFPVLRYMEPNENEEEPDN